jgi:hypothetical protein
MGVLAQLTPGRSDIGTHNRLFQIMQRTSNDNPARSALAVLATRFMPNLEAELNL